VQPRNAATAQCSHRGRPAGWPALHNERVDTRRDVAVVLSGGGINGVLLELGFLKRLRESPLWPRIGCIFGTSAGAVTGTSAALDRLDELERFLFSLRPEDTFRPQRLWRTPLLGLNDYTLPQTIAERLGDPTELAGDATPSLPVIQHAARFVEKSDGVRMDWVLLLQPTSPLRTAHDIRAAIERAGKKNCTAVVSVTEAGHSHPYLMRRIEGDLLLPFRDDQPEARRVQDFEPKAYLVNGAIYLTRRDILLEEGSLYGDVVAPYVMPRERSVDVDTEEDLLLAESLLRRRSDGATGRAS